MKLLTLNFVTCARKSCRTSAASFPLHPSAATLEILEAPINPQLLTNLLPRLDWVALRSVAAELGLPGLSEGAPAAEDLWADAGASQSQSQSQPQQHPLSRTSTNRSLSSSYVLSQDVGVSQGAVDDEDEMGGLTQHGEDDEEREPSELARHLHRVLMETCVKEGKLVCGNCGHEYHVREGIANFLLPAHLV